MTKPVTVAIVGGSGFVGRELLRLVLNHPAIDLVQITSREHTKKAVASVHTAFEGLSDLKFSEFNAAEVDADFVLIAQAHCESMHTVKALSLTDKFRRGEMRVIDLGADFRLPANQFKQVYGEEHVCPELLESAVYGLPELFPERISQSQLIANPGCFAHCIFMSLAPLVTKGLIQPKVRVAAVTGSSGSGVMAQEKTHHPNRNESMSAYQVLCHRHAPEITAAWQSVSPNQLSSTKNALFDLKFVPISGPFSRGIFASVFAELKDQSCAVDEIFADFALARAFVRLRNETPKLLDVRGSNFIDLAVTQQGTDVVVLSALDNMVKGAAGNAIQCLNLMADFNQTLGINSAPLNP